MSSVLCCDICGDRLDEKDYPLIDGKIPTGRGFISITVPTAGRDCCRKCLVAKLREVADKIEKWERR